ncbi:MAG: glycine C-acetyltransferase [Candidatus Nephrothrix sp. EaCA]|nr:MAG: glycine C-acetyltransferase [Candidatus Nephrothrix sp. EaCA]
MEFYKFIADKIAETKEQGLYKNELALTSPQSNRVTAGSQPLINFCANNYLGLANHELLIAEAKKALDKHGFGMASVRFICGTQTIHQELEQKLAGFLGFDDAILYSSCFDANGGIFETLLDENDAVISDSLNHASLIDGIRLCKAKRFRYSNSDMNDLEQQLMSAKDSRFKLIVTDGVFSMDGIIANLKGICDLAEKYNALVMVDDSHAVGVIGERGAGSPEYCGVEGRVHIVTGTLGKALGGASGGYAAAQKPVIEWLRQRSRPYLFSNSLAPMITAVSILAISLVESPEGKKLRQKLAANAQQFRRLMSAEGFQLLGADHPIIPVLLGDALTTSKMAASLVKEGIFAVGFSFPVVAKDKARIRTQLSAAHSADDINRAAAAFVKSRP